MSDEKKAEHIVAAVGTASSRSPLGRILSEAETAALSYAFAHGVSVHDNDGIAAARLRARSEVRALLAQLPDGATVRSFAELVAATTQ